MKDRKKRLRTKINTFVRKKHIELNVTIKLFILLLCIVSLSKCVSVEQNVCNDSVIVNNITWECMELPVRNRR